MPSVKQTLILLPLLGLAAAAPTNLPRDVGNTADGAPSSVLDAVDYYPAGGSGNQGAEANRVNGAIQRRSPQYQKRGTLTDGSELVAETTGSTLKFVGDTGVKAVKAVPSIWDTFWSALKGKNSKRDVSGASVDAVSTLGKRRSTVTQQGESAGMAVTSPTANVPLASSSNPKMAEAEVRMANAKAGSQERQNELLGVTAKTGEIGLKSLELGNKQKQFQLDKEKAQWKAQNTPTGALKQRLTNYIAGSTRNMANTNPPLSSQGGLNTNPSLSSQGGLASAAPGSVASVSGMPSTGRNPTAAAGPADTLHADETGGAIY
ncbi:uncharacterized protein PgNI_12430 [Pyricularia grisea]|uniref:Uncharacterized protein n=1 Tax=Pyricularia grisea TaxID=148305 RepID=A0A6P8AMG4_PYRGI|nr:uncharacterized protein PgNI_12430 [Pyricularia grisea]TLD03221.1 hypothetical protein PgNI_12430 [Pyricularia grisea]